MIFDPTGLAKHYRRAYHIFTVFMNILSRR